MTKLNYLEFFYSFPLFLQQLEPLFLSVLESVAASGISVLETFYPFLSVLESLVPLSPFVLESASSLFLSDF